MDNGQILEFTIEDMLDDGRAYGRYEGLSVFVSGGCSLGKGMTAAGAVPGDAVSVKVTRVRKNIAEAELLSISSPSPDRVTAECPYFGECGGCTLHELSYEAQKTLKTEQVRNKLTRLAGLEDPVVNDIIGADDIKYYRSKAVFAVGPHGEVGFNRGRSHHVIDVDDCILQSDPAMVCADALRYFLKETGCGYITQMTVRTAFGTGEVMAVLELGARPETAGKSHKGKTRKANNSHSSDIPREIPDAEKLVSLLDDAVYSLAPEDEEPFYSLESVAVNRNGKCRIIAGKQTITETFCTENGREISYEISPQSFFQVNPEQMVKLYDKIAEYAALSGGETVLDLYCGAGTIGIWLLNELRSRDEEAYAGTRVLGIESVKPAVIDANRNSVINNMVNTRYICGKAEEELPGMMGLTRLYKWNEVNERVEREPELRIGRAGLNADCDERLFAERIDVAVLDPPRAGCDETLLEAVVKSEPERIVYVSCDPGTLARDIKYLTSHGYQFIECTPIDQFIGSGHIEACCFLTK